MPQPFQLGRLVCSWICFSYAYAVKCSTSRRFNSFHAHNLYTKNFNAKKGADMPVDRQAALTCNQAAASITKDCAQLHAAASCTETQHPQCQATTPSDPAPPPSLHRPTNQPAYLTMTGAQCCLPGMQQKESKMPRTVLQLQLAHQVLQKER